MDPPLRRSTTGSITRRDVSEGHSSSPASTIDSEPVKVEEAGQPLPEDDQEAPQPALEGEGGADAPFKPDWRFYLAFVAIASLTLAAAIDATALSTALPAMTEDLNGSAIESFWAGTSFLITSAIVMPIVAALSHIFGRKPCMQVGSFIFAVGSIVGALAPSMIVCLVGRAIQGIGAGAVIVLGEIILTDLVPLKFRGKWLGWLGTMWTLGGVIGPLAGGAFAQYVTWRWIFWINVPFIAIGAGLLAFFLKQEKIEGHPWAKVLRVDWFGALLFTTSASAILVPISVGGILLKWDSWAILLPIIAGLFGLAFFIWWEKNHAKEPLIPLTIFANWSVRSLYVQTVLHALVFWATFYYLPLYYQVVKQYSIFQSGLAMLPQTVVVSPMTVLIGFLISKLNRFWWIVFGGWGCTALGAALLILLDSESKIAYWVIYNCILCLGIGTLITAMNIAVQAAVKPYLSGHAVAFYVFLRQFGEGLGVAIGGVIFQNELQKNLNKYEYWRDFAEKYSQKATTLGPIVKALEDGPKKTELITSYNSALRTVWIAALAISVLGFLLVMLVKDKDLDQKHDTQQAFVMQTSPTHTDFGESGLVVDQSAAGQNRQDAASSSSWCGGQQVVDTHFDSDALDELNAEHERFKELRQMRPRTYAPN